MRDAKPRRLTDERNLDMIDYADLIHSALGDIEQNTDRIATALEALLELQKQRQQTDA